MVIDQKAFFAEAKRLQEEFGMTRDQAEMLAAYKFWDGADTAKNALCQQQRKGSENGNVG